MREVSKTLTQILLGSFIRMNINGKIYMIIVVAIASLSSCCVFPHYFKDEYIECNKPETLKSIDNEFCVLIGGAPSMHSHFVLYQLLDVDSAYLSLTNVKICQKKKNLKYKIKMYEQNKWVECDNEVLRGESLICFEFKSKLHFGDSIVIVENIFPSTKDSLTTRIIISELDQTIRTIHNQKIIGILGHGTVL